MGTTTLGRERATNPFLHELAPLSDRIQAPRGTFDVLGEAALARKSLEDIVALDPRARRLHADRDADLRVDRAVRARRRASRPTSSRRRCTRSTTAAGTRSRCAPRAPRRSRRAYLEHGMHKLPQPVKLWYLGAVLPPRAPAAGPLPAVRAGGSGGDRLRRPRRRRRADPAARRDPRGASAPAGCGCGSRASARRTRAPRTATSLQAYLRQHEDRLSQDVRDRIDLNPLRAFDADHPGTREVMRGAPLLLDRLNAEDAEHFATVKAAARRRRARLRGRPDAGARPGLLHAHGVRVHVRRARRAVGRRRRRAATTG